MTDKEIEKKAEDVLIDSGAVLDRTDWNDLMREVKKAIKAAYDAGFHDGVNN